MPDRENCVVRKFKPADFVSAGFYHSGDVNRVEKGEQSAKILHSSS